MKLIVSLPLTLILLPIVMAGNATGPVRVIATGKTSAMPILRSWLLVDPSIDGTIIPSRTEGRGDMSSDEVRKFMRIYFPRTFEDFLDYDFLFLAMVDMTFFTPQQVQWMFDGIKEHGIGGISTRSIMSMNPIWSDPWIESLLSKAFPNDALAVIQTPYNQKASGRLTINDDDRLAPVVSPFKDEVERIFEQGILTVPKAGSRVYTWLKGNGAFGLPEYIPHLFEWDYGKGITLTALDMIYDPFWQTTRNQFALDIVANVIWHGSHRDLPEDAMKVHFLRKRLQSFVEDKAFIISIFDFVERFGANTDELYADLLGVQQEKARVNELYVNGEFDESSEMMDDLQKELAGLSADAMRLKDAALRWVYFVEWLTVIGTSLACGSVVWILMVRRRLYREVAVTRSDLDRQSRREYGR